MMRRIGVAGVVLLLAVGLVSATSLVKMTFGDLARDADRIVVGTVTDVTGDWDDSLTFIHSNVTLSVESSLRGPALDEIVLRTPGGFVGGMGQKAHGAATFEVGEKVLVFLTTWEDGTPKVLGYVQGKSNVVVDDRGTDRLAGGSADGLSLADAVNRIRQDPDRNIPLRPAN